MVTYKYHIFFLKNSINIGNFLLELQHRYILSKFIGGLFMELAIVGGLASTGIYYRFTINYRRKRKVIKAME